MRALIVSGVLVLVALSAQCFDPHYPDGLPCSGAGDCPPGQTCVAGACTHNPDLTDARCGQPEQCNEIDDDCDGLIDETGPGDAGVCHCVDGRTQPCAIGTCPADGTQTCAGGEWGDCVGATAPTMEVCDGVRDDDCDGVVDQPDVCSCTNGQLRDCGQCNDGRETCDLAGQWGACTGGTPPGPCCPGQSRPCGSCNDGVQSCGADGQWGTCAGATPTGACCPGQVRQCGNCSDGVQSCALDGQWGTCAGATPTGPCCPGQTRSCGTDTGECHAGVESCTATGTWSGTCAGAQGPVPEVCNGRDDNCNGSTDEIPTCTACIPIGTVLVDRMAPPYAGDNEFGGHGPEVWVSTSYRPNGTQVCADVYVRMLETAGNPPSEARKTVSRCVSTPGTVASVITPNSVHHYIDTDRDDIDPIAVQAGTGIGQIGCSGDTSNEDICNDQSLPGCSGCQVSGICVKVRYQ